MADARQILWLRNVYARRGDFVAAISRLRVRSGDRLAIVGGSGSGKSTILI